MTQFKFDFLFKKRSQSRLIWSQIATLRIIFQNALPYSSNYIIWNDRSLSIKSLVKHEQIHVIKEKKNLL